MTQPLAPFTLKTGTRTINAISGRLSLRAPQRRSLEILGRVTDILDMTGELNPQEALELVRSEFPTVEDFERTFPSLCFALATGVGKTRLMGAFVTYLYAEKGIKHFFVVAPNLTVYDKLIADFTPNTPKYVFQGIAEFVTTPPDLITGDTYQQYRVQPPLGLYSPVEINIFNISKINSEVRGGNAPLIKRFREIIGTSYFDYLAGLKDLVLLMDESHHYRASAGVRAINELKPVLGLELTATPQVERGGKAILFKNVVYSYPLSSALKDGFVKEPTVITRENFNPENYKGDGQLERLKLEDAVRLHEDTKVELDLYARQNDTLPVKPFILVIAQHTEHAGMLLETIQSDNFFEGRYKNRVITVHSSLTGEEREDNVQRLMQVENPKEPTEIVIHVNMLKEGWDVTNLYTIVPLRAANSKTLIEQSIGRGLRLPFGRRTGVKPVDRLNIIAHDKFSEIIAEANKPESILRTGLVIGRDIHVEARTAITVTSGLDEAFAEPPTDEVLKDEAVPGVVETTPPSKATLPPQPRIFETGLERQMARRVRAAISEQYSHLPTSQALLQPEVQAGLREIAQRAAVVQRLEDAGEGAAEQEVQRPDPDRIVATVTSMFMERTIDIPLIRFTPIGRVTGKYECFDLDLDFALQPVSQDILIHYLRTHERERLRGVYAIWEARPENYLVNHLRLYDDVSYDTHAEVLYDLAGQVVAHARGYLANEDAVDNVLHYHGRRLAELVHTQMQANYCEESTAYEVKVVQGFSQLRANSYDAPEGCAPVDFQQTVSDPQRIRRMIFSGFGKCLYPLQKFDSNTELEFARLLERDEDTLKWFKPARTQLSIHYERGHYYEPDFVVETRTHKYLCEPKRRDQVDDETVQKKARAAATWCRHASEHAQANGAKPWAYLLIPHDAFNAATTLQTLADTYTVT